MRAFIIVIILLTLPLPIYADEIDDLIPAIILIESGGNQNAYNSRSGAIGLMQITPIVLREYYKEEGNYVKRNTKYPQSFNIGEIYEHIYEGEFNVYIGEWYLHRLKNHYLKQDYTIERLLASYNMGYAKLKRLNFEWWKVKETKNYVNRIMKLYKKGGI